METYSGGTSQGANWSRAGTGGSTGSTTGGTGGTPGTTGASTGGTGQSDRPQENLTDQARDAASTMVHAARAQATSRISEQKTRAANTLGGVASALHVAGQQIRDQEGSPAAPYVQRAADELDRFANYLDRVELNEVIREVETFARRNQALFLGGAFLLGVLGARFLKSSARQDDYRASQGYGGSMGYSGAGRETTYDRGTTRILPPTGGYGDGGYTGSNPGTQRTANDTMRSTEQGTTSSGYSDRGTT